MKMKINPVKGEKQKYHLNAKIFHKNDWNYYSIYW